MVLYCTVDDTAWYLCHKSILCTRCTSIGLHFSTVHICSPSLLLSIVTIQAYKRKSGCSLCSSPLLTLWFLHRPMEQALSPREPREVSRGSIGGSGQGSVEFCSTVPYISQAAVISMYTRAMLLCYL